MNKLIIPLNVQRFASSNGCSVTVSETTNTANNTSTFVVSATVTTNSTTYNQTTSGAYVQGSYSGGASGTLSKQSFKIAKSSSVTKTWTIENVQHNSDGTLGEITFSVTWYVTSSSSSHGTTTKSIQPATIPRYTSTTNLQIASKTETSFTVNWATANACSQIRYGTSTGSYTTANVNGNSGQFTISGLNPNSQYTIYFMPKRSDSGLWGDGSANTWSSYPAQYTYDYPKVNSIYDITLKPSTSDPNTDLWINFDNPLGKTFRYEVISDVDSSVIYSENNFSGSSIGIPLTSEILSNFYETIPAAKSGTYHVNVYYQNITKTSGSKKYTIDPDTCKPTMSVVGYEDVEAATLALTGNDQVLIKNYSTIQVTIPANNKATANMHSSIVGYKIKNGDYVSPTPIPEVEGQDVVLTCTTTNGLIEVYAIDSREQSDVYQIVNVPLVDYKPIEKGQYPIAQRCDSEGIPNGIGEYVKITLEGNFWNNSFGSVTNSITSISYNYKNTQSSSTPTPGETSITATVTNNKYEVDQLILGDTEEGFDVSNSYIINVTVEDKLSSTTFTMTLGSGTPHIAYSPNGVSIMGKYNEQAGGLLQVAGVPIQGGGGITGDTVPIGAIMPYSSSYIPENWLECNGQAVSRTDYADLFQRIGTTFGAGDGSTTFNVPNFNTRVPVGYDSTDTDFNAIGKTGGSKNISYTPAGTVQNHTLTANESGMPNHRHSNGSRKIDVAKGTSDYWGVPYSSQDLSYAFYSQYEGGWDAAEGHNHGFNGTATTLSIVQPYITTKYIIKAFQSAGVVAQVSNTQSDSTTNTYSCNYVNDKLAVNYVCASFTNTVTLSQEWQRPTLNTATTYGNKLELRNGSVYVKSGVKKVRVSASLFFENMNSSHVSYIWAFINKNNGEITNSIVSGQAVYFVTANISPVVVSVQEGDYFNLNINNASYQNGNYPTVRAGYGNTRLVLEVVE